MSPLRFLVIQLSCWLTLALSVAAFGETKPGCQAKCGNISIPYPFGITPVGMDDTREAGGCSIHGDCPYSYNVNCNTSYHPPKPFIGTTNFEIQSISESEIRVKGEVAKICYNMVGDLVLDRSESFTSLFETPFTFSNTTNRFFLIGCNSIGYNGGYDQHMKVYRTQCMTSCDSREEVHEGSCNGNGCCMSTIPAGLKFVQMDVKRADNITNTTFASYFDPC
ncbi:hypothetical protein MKW92_027149, partial [Papaver armeniacum]